MQKKTGLFGLWQRPWVRWAVPITGLIGIVLIGLSEWLPSGGSNTVQAVDVAAYTRTLEQRLETLVEHIQGAGKSRVLVTLESGVEYIYADDNKSASSQSEENGQTNKNSHSEEWDSRVVLSDGKGLLITELQPTVRGVAVVCEGGDNEAVRQAVCEAVATALNISTRRVCVMPSS